MQTQVTIEQVANVAFHESEKSLKILVISNHWRGRHLLFHSSKLRLEWNLFALVGDIYVTK